MTEGGWAIGESELALDGMLSDPVAHSLELVAGGEMVKVIWDGVLVARLVPPDWAEQAARDRETAEFARRELHRLAASASDSHNLMGDRLGLGTRTEVRKVARLPRSVAQYPKVLA